MNQEMLSREVAATGSSLPQFFNNEVMSYLQNPAEHRNLLRILFSVNIFMDTKTVKISFLIRKIMALSNGLKSWKQSQIRSKS